VTIVLEIEGIEIYNPEKVAEYCQRHPEVLEILSAAVQTVQEAFPHAGLSPTATTTQR
jgi:hypothetical protein